MNLYGVKRKFPTNKIKKLTLAEFLEASEKAARNMANKNWKDFKLIIKENKR